MCYLEHILQTFNSIFEGGADLVHVNAHSAQILQSRTPKISNGDLEFPRRKMDDGTLFPFIEDHRKHDSIWHQLQTIDVPIPTLHTCFQDLHYLTIARNVMRSLFIPDPEQKVTIDEALGAHYHANVTVDMHSRKLTIKCQLCEF